MSRKQAHIPQPGERFGRLTVIKQGESEVDAKTQKKKSRYWCQCDCGSSEKLIRGASLVNGSIQSCGCLHDEISSRIMSESTHGKKYNEYDLSGSYGIGYTFKNDEFYFDLEDYDKIKNICWFIDGRGYVVGHDTSGCGKSIKMHQIILPTDNDHIVDHINTCAKNDNRKINLRVATQKENTRNRKISSNNTSGKTGISFDRRKNKWVAYIGYNHKNLYLGSFVQYQDAVDARIKAEDQYFGEFKYVQFNKIKGE